MENLWQLHFILDTSVIKSQQKKTVEWSTKGYGEQYRFISKITNIFQTTFYCSLPKQLKGIVEFETISIVTLDNNQYLLCLNIASNGNIGLYDNSFSMLIREFELAILAIPNAIEKINSADSTHPEKIQLTQYEPQLLNQVQVSHPLCRQLIGKMRVIREKKIFPITIMLPDSSRLSIDIRSIAKSSEFNASQNEIISGRIIEYSDKDQRFLLLPKGSKSQLVYIPSISSNVRAQLLSNFISKLHFEILVKPSMEYIGGEQKYKAFQFIQIIVPDAQFDFD